jgi:porin
MRKSLNPIWQKPLGSCSSSASLGPIKKLYLTFLLLHTAFTALAGPSFQETAAPSQTAPFAAPPTPKTFQQSPPIASWPPWGSFPSRNTLSLSGSYTGEISAITSGGRRQGSVYNAVLALMVDSDFGPLLGWEGWISHLHCYYPHGESGTLSYAGDLNTFSNIDFYDSPRLFEAWLEGRAFDGKAALRFGLFALDSEFAIGGTDLSNLFINSTFGADGCVSLNFPAPLYAIAAPGLSFRFEPAPQWLARAAIYDGNPASGFTPDPSPNSATSTDFNRHGLDVSLRKSEGALLAFELGYTRNPSPAPSSEPSSACPPPRGLFGSYKAGLLYHTDSFADAYQRTLTSLGSSLAPEKVRSHSGFPELSLAVDQEVWRSQHSETEGLKSFFRVCWCPEDRSLADYSLNAGLIYQGPFHSRPEDRLAAAFAYVHVSDAISSATRTATFRDGLAAPVPDSESILELTYLAKLTPSWDLQPNLQLIFNPGGSGQYENALVLTLRTVVRF